VKPRQSSFKAIAASSNSLIWLCTLSRSSGSAITSAVSPTRLRRGPTGTPALLRRAIARRESPPCVIGIEPKPFSEFGAEELGLLILELPAGAIATTMAATNKCLAKINKSDAGGKATKKQSANQWVSTGH
jgi:hypothetical protein